MPKTIEFTIHMQPVAKGRPRFGDGRVFTPKETKDFESQFRLTANRYRPSIRLEGPIKLTVVFHFVAPNKPKHYRHIVRPDLSNLIKSVEDALNPCKKIGYVGFWKDDSCIDEIHTYKMYTVKPWPSIRVKIESEN